MHHGFPLPADILRLSPDSLRRLGFSLAKARSLLELAQAAEAGQLEREELNKLNDDRVLGLLMSLRGIGRWTAEYALLRGLGRIDVFPGDDVGARNRLAQWLGRDGPMDYESVRRAVRQWNPYSGFVYFHLLLKGLAESKALPEDGSWNTPSSGAALRQGSCQTKVPQGIRTRSSIIRSNTGRDSNTVPR